MSNYKARPKGSRLADINPGVQDVVFATLKYPNDVLVNLKTSWLNPRKGRDITVVGDRRMLTFDDMNLQEPIRVYDKGVTEEKVGGVVDTFASFRASVREGDITIPKLEDTLRRGNGRYKDTR